VNRSTTMLAVLLAGSLIHTPARAQLIAAEGYSTTVVASQDGSRETFGGLLYDALEYNPTTDSWLTVNQQGFDDVVEITRGGVFRTLSSNFDLGGLSGTHLAVSNGNNAWVGEVHARSIYKLTPAGEGANRTLATMLPGDTNGSCPETGVSEVEGNGDMIAGFGPWYPSVSSCPGAQPGAPRDWYRVTPEGVATKLFSTTGSHIVWLRRDDVTGQYFAIDVFDSGQTDPTAALFNYQAPRLLTIDMGSGSTTLVRQYAGATLADPEVDRTGSLSPSHVIWAIRNGTEVVPLDAETGEPGPAIALAAQANTIVGLALAPATRNRAVSSLYALTSEATTSGVTIRHVEIASAGTVVQNRLPVCALAKASPNVIWPPRHTLVPISITGISDPDGDPVTTTVTAVSQDEPVNAAGDGSTTPDAQIDSGAVSVRAERSGTGNGRVYQLAIRAEDARGGVCTTTLQLCVPRAGPQHGCTDDGQQYDSLAR
jgi:hypothetical protein